MEEFIKLLFFKTY